MGAPVFLDRDVVMDIHLESLRRHGGLDGLRDETLYAAMIDIACKRVDKAGLAALFRGQFPAGPA